MAWTTSKPNGVAKSVTLASEKNVTLPASATTEYSSVIDFLELDPSKANRNVTVSVKASAVSGTNLDIGLYGSDSATGTFSLLLDAVVADVTDGTAKVAVVDLNAYPAPFYKIGWTSDADESANTVDVNLYFAALN